MDENDEQYDGGGWAGDGSGTDDLADMNQNEADDYRNEGADDDVCDHDEGGEDSYLDASWEDRMECYGGE